jgi:hypothetical protein
MTSNPINVPQYRPTSEAEKCVASLRECPYCLACKTKSPRLRQVIEDSLKRPVSFPHLLLKDPFTTRAQFLFDLIRYVLTGKQRFSSSLDGSLSIPDAFTQYGE